MVASSSKNKKSQPLTQHSQDPPPKILTSLERARNAPHEDGLARVERHRRVQDVVGIGQPPRPDLHGLVLDGRRRHRNVQLVVLRVARLDQLLDAALLLEKRKKQVLF